MLAVCDHDKMAAAFVPSDRHVGPALYVEFPAGIQGVHSEEMIERATKQGLVVMAHKKYIFFFQIRQWLVFQNIERSEKRVRVYFRTYSLPDAPVPIPIIKGSVKWRAGHGTMEVCLHKRIPSDREFKRDH